MAENNKWIERKKRNFLKDLLPLKNPFSIQIETTNACNFKCIYCNQFSNTKKEYDYISLEAFQEFIEGAKVFPNKLKTVIFCGGGEPLLNKNIFEMIKLSKEICDEVVLITNGSLLTPETGQKLIKSGLDSIRVSLQGVDSEAYYKTCGYKINFEKFLLNLKYFYENKGRCKLCLKMPDIAINTEEKQSLFYDLFQDICDDLIIQPIVPTQDKIDFTKIKSDYSETVNKEETIQDVKVCPQPFFTLQLTAKGMVRPCCTFADECLEIGDITKNTLPEIWNGEKLKNLRRLLLKGQRSSYKFCKDCTIPLYTNNKYDNLDNDADKLLKVF